MNCYAVVTWACKSPSCKNHVRQFSRNGVGRGYLLAVTGSVWMLQCLRPRLHQGAGLNCSNRTRILCVYTAPQSGLQWKFPLASFCFRCRGALLVNNFFKTSSIEWVVRILGPLAFTITSKLGRPEAGTRLPPDLVRMRTCFWYRILIFMRLHQNLVWLRAGLRGRPNAWCKRGLSSCYGSVSCFFPLLAWLLWDGLACTVFSPEIFLHLVQNEQMSVG